jgi:hypothetical protein
MLPAELAGRDGAVSLPRCLCHKAYTQRTSSCIASLPCGSTIQRSLGPKTKAKCTDCLCWDVSHSCFLERCWFASVLPFHSLCLHSHFLTSSPILFIFLFLTLFPYLFIICIFCSFLLHFFYFALLYVFLS